MEFNIKWVVIGVIFMIVLVMFGRNPGEESRKRKEEAAKDPNALIHAIEKHNTKGRMPQVGDSMSNILNFGDKKAPPAPLPGTPYPQDNTAMPPQHAPNYNRMQNTYRRPGNAYPNAQNPSPGNTEPKGDDSYYPPPANTPSSRFMPQSSLTPELENGKTVRFLGSKAYALDARGNLAPMPDGVYKMKDSPVTVVIRGGRKIAIQ